MAQAFIGLGSNLGDREAHLHAALAALRRAPGIAVRNVSRFIETAPQGGPPQRRFLNAAAELHVTMSARELLARLLDIESGRGRTRLERWGPRTLDLDLLLYDDETISEPDLQVPHPRMHERLFVLRPLAEIAPGALHPVMGASVGDLLDALLRSIPPARPGGSCRGGAAV